MMGPMTQIHRSSPSPATAAGPRERAGLSDPPEDGPVAVARPGTAKPTASGPQVAVSTPRVVKRFKVDVCQHKRAYDLR
jgi:hypothetical protein